ncbi:MAG TPA: DMT family transporter [Flexilinea sp.]|nr:DMT family transporter [Flexilinea sp.]
MEQNTGKPFSQHSAAEKRKIILLFLVCIFLWASAFTAITIGAREFEPGHLALLRYGFASLILIVYALLKKMPLPRLRDVPIFLLTGFLSFTLYNITLITGQKTVPAGTSSVIIALNPVIVALLAGLVLNEKLNRNGIIGIFIAFIGVVIAVIDWKHGLTLTKGVFWILIASLSASTSTILQKKWIARYSGEQVMTYSIWGGTLLLLFYLPGLVHSLPSISTKAILTALYLGAFPGVIAYLVWGYLLSEIPAHQANSFLFMDTIGAMLIAWLVLGEVPGIQVLFGFILILIGLFLVNGSRQSEKVVS